MNNINNIKLNKTGKIIDLLKTVLIYGLTISMLSVAGLYINARQNYGQKEEIPLEKRRIFESGGIVAAEMDENHVKPVQITVTVENKSITCIYDEQLISKVYEDYKNIISGLFRRSECVRLDEDDGAAIWKKCVEKENSVYIRYAGNYIYPVLVAFLDMTGEPFPVPKSESGLAEIHELFIADEDPAYGVAKDIYGNISVFLPDEFLKDIILTQAINTNSLQSAYNSSAGGIPCKFLGSGDINAETGINRNDIKNLVFAEDFHIFYNYNVYNTSSGLYFLNPLLKDYDINHINNMNSADKINSINSALYNTGNTGENSSDNIKNIKRIDIDRDYIKAMFKIFNFNAETARSHSDSRSQTYTDGQSKMIFTADGRITYNYTSSDIFNINDKDGAHLSRFLGFDADSYTFFEKLKAASAFVSGLGRELTGGPEVSLYLKDIQTGENQNLNMTFVYYYDGTEIKLSGCDYGIFISIGEDMITEAIINSFYAVSQPINRNINPMLILSGFDGMILKDLKNLEELEDLETSENSEDSTDTTDQTNITAVEKVSKNSKEEIADKYKIKYDKNQDKFIVNRIELIYNINYSDISGISGGIGEARAEWIIQ